MKPCMRSLISCMRCSVYVHHKCTCNGSYLHLAINPVLNPSILLQFPIPLPRNTLIYMSKLNSKMTATWGKNMAELNLYTCILHSLPDIISKIHPKVLSQHPLAEGVQLSLGVQLFSITQKK